MTKGRRESGRLVFTRKCLSSQMARRKESRRREEKQQRSGLPWFVGWRRRRQP